MSAIVAMSCGFGACDGIAIYRSSIYGATGSMSIVLVQEVQRVMQQPSSAVRMDISGSTISRWACRS